MSYTEYLRTKMAAETKVIAVQKPTDASMYITKKRMVANQVFYQDGTSVGTLTKQTDRPVYNNASVSSKKATGKRVDASTYTSYRGGVGVRDTSITEKTERVVQTGCCETGQIDSTFIARSFTSIPADGDYSIIFVVGEDTTQSGKTIYKSSNGGESWTLIEGGFLRAGYGITADGNGNLVAVGTFDDGNNTSILYSEDSGFTWTSRSSQYFAIEGHGVAYDESIDTFVLVGNDGNGGNHIKCFDSWNALKGLTGFENDITNISSAQGGFSTTGQGWGVSTDGNGQFVVVGEDSNNNTIFYNTDVDDITDWTSNVGSAFAVAGYGVANNGNDFWVMTGDDGGPQNNIKYFDEGVNTSCASSSIAFQTMGTSVTYGGTVPPGEDVWFITGKDQPTFIGATTGDITNSEGNEIKINTVNIAYCFYLLYAIFIGGQDPYPVQVLFGPEQVYKALGFPLIGGGSAKKWSYSSGSDYMRSRLCSTTCNSGNPGKPLFVDNTISLSAMHPRMVATDGCCDHKIEDPNHTHSPGIQVAVNNQPYAVGKSFFMSNPPLPEGPNVSDNKVGGYLGPRSGYVENKHGYVKPSRETPKAPGGQGQEPAHLKINKPTLFSIKSS